MRQGVKKASLRLIALPLSYGSLLELGRVHQASEKNTTHKGFCLKIIHSRSKQKAAPTGN